VDRITILDGRRIILGVTGSIAAYKAVDLASKLTQAGTTADVILTDSAQRFVTPLTFQAVTGRPVYTSMWQTDSADSLPTHIAHVGLGEGANLMVIAPITAHHIGKIANGLADDLLSLTALSARCPLVIAPAMDGAMLEHPAVVENLRRLQDRGVTVIESEEGRMASGMLGRGRLPETPTLLGLIRHMVGREFGPLRDRRIIVTAGGTREALDPVRFITNRSSGKQGYAVAQAALDAGASVTLITTPTGLVPPPGAHVIMVESAQDMLDAVLDGIVEADALIMAAAVSDFRPEHVAEHKIKKDGADQKVGRDLRITLTPTTDILLTVGQQRHETGYPHVLIGFAAETEDLISNARSKLARKNADYMIANDVTASGAGFQADTNVVTILGSDGSLVTLPQQTKIAVAEAIIQRVAARLQTVPRH
jgi:phosphopantothenoylcysteine decarboxylase/phosphopantothenate--cysteine ligase